MSFEIDEPDKSYSSKKNVLHATLKTLEVLVVVIAIAIIVSTFFISVLQIRGNSMEPTLQEGDLVVASHSSNFEHGDVIAFYYNNKVLLKRVIGFPGDWIDIEDDGSVIVNNKRLDENYVFDLASADSDIAFPYQVPENRYFVLGDHRSVSIDSRSNVVGNVSSEQVVGNVMFRIWPLDRIGHVS